MAEEQDAERGRGGGEKREAVEEQAMRRAMERTAESPQDLLRVGGGSDNFGRGDRSMFDPAAEEDPERPGDLDGSIQP